MRILTLLLALTLAAVACGGTQVAPPTPLDPGVAQELIESDPELVVIDIRTPEEVAAGTVPGTDEFIDFYSPTFQAQIEELDRDATYLVYCHSGNRTREAAQVMRDLGFASVLELEGGILAWANSGQPLARGPET